MQIEPSAEQFAARYAAGAPQVVWTTLVADLETPVSAFLKVAGAKPKNSTPMSFLLESVEGGAVRGRYSIIGLEPDLIFRASGRRAEINRSPQNDPHGFSPPVRRRLRHCAHLSAKAASCCRMRCRRWPPACSAISATTWC